MSVRAVTVWNMAYPLPAAAIISVDDLANLQDRAALAAHLADKAAGRAATSLSSLDAALDRIDAEDLA